MENQYRPISNMNQEREIPSFNQNVVAIDHLCSSLECMPITFPLRSQSQPQHPIKISKIIDSDFLKDSQGLNEGEDCQLKELKVADVCLSSSPSVEEMSIFSFRDIIQQNNYNPQQEVDQTLQQDEFFNPQNIEILSQLKEFLEEDTKKATLSEIFQNGEMMTTYCQKQQFLLQNKHFNPKTYFQGAFIIPSEKKNLNLAEKSNRSSLKSPTLNSHKTQKHYNIPINIPNKNNSQIKKSSLSISKINAHSSTNGSSNISMQSTSEISSLANSKNLGGAVGSYSSETNGYFSASMLKGQDLSPTNLKKSSKVLFKSDFSPISNVFSQSPFLQPDNIQKDWEINDYSQFSFCSTSNLMQKVTQQSNLIPQKANYLQPLASENINLETKRVQIVNASQKQLQNHLPIRGIELQLLKQEDKPKFVENNLGDLGNSSSQSNNNQLSEKSKESLTEFDKEHFNELKQDHFFGQIKNDGSQSCLSKQQYLGQQQMNPFLSQQTRREGKVTLVTVSIPQKSQACTPSITSLDERDCSLDQVGRQDKSMKRISIHLESTKYHQYNDKIPIATNEKSFTNRANSTSKEGLKQKSHHVKTHSQPSSTLFHQLPLPSNQFTTSSNPSHPIPQNPQPQNKRVTSSISQNPSPSKRGFSNFTSKVVSCSKPPSPNKYSLTSQNSPVNRQFNNQFSSKEIKNNKQNNSFIEVKPAVTIFSPTNSQPTINYKNNSQLKIMLAEQPNCQVTKPSTGNNLYNSSFETKSFISPFKSYCSSFKGENDSKDNTPRVNIIPDHSQLMNKQNQSTTSISKVLQIINKGADHKKEKLNLQTLNTINQSLSVRKTPLSPKKKNESKNTSRVGSPNILKAASASKNATSRIQLFSPKLNQKYIDLYFEMENLNQKAGQSACFNSNNISITSRQSFQGLQYSQQAQQQQIFKVDQEKKAPE